MLNERGPSERHRMGDERRAGYDVILIEQHRGQKIKMRPGQVTDRRQLAGRVVPRDPPPLDLVARAFRRDGVNPGLRVAGLHPSECLAKQVFRQIACWVVGGSRDAARAQLTGNLGVEGKQRGR
jgi:hypothetical protein